MSGIQTGWDSQWKTLANAITSYYGGGISSAQYKQVVQMLDSGNYTMEEMESILAQIPEFNRTYNAAGELIQVSYGATAAGNTTAGSVANAVNSNAASATQTQFQTVQNITKDTQTGKVTMSDTVTKYSGGTAGTAKAVASSAIGAIAATSVGISVGKSIDSRLYNANPQFWDSHGMSTLNPETWNSITAGRNTLGATLFNFVFGLTPDTNNPQPYIDETTFAYMVAYMISQGVFDTGETTVDIDDPTGLTTDLMNSLPVTLSDTDLHFTRYVNGSPSDSYYFSINNTSPMYACMYESPSIPNNPKFLFVSKDNFTLYRYRVSTGTIDNTYTAQNGVVNGQRVYYYSYPITQTNNPIFDEVTSQHHNNAMAGGSFSNDQLAYVILFGTMHQSGGGVDGITPQEGVTQFDASGINDPSNIAAVLAALMSQFPELWDNRMEISPDGDTTHIYIPVGFPTGGTGIQPTTVGATATDLAPDIAGDGANVTDELIKTLIDMIQNPQYQNGVESDTNTPTEPIDPNMPNTGGGVTPPFVIPTGSASALYSVYNPSQSQLNSLGSWLWSSNFVDQLLKLFNDPMQAIIGLHKIFATPPTSGTGTIKVGYLDSGVGSNLVSAQYTEVDCGTVKIDEYFKNALDYLKTDIYLYLPFVGIVPLNVEDVTRASINVKYKIDVLTGACLATVNVTRDANGGGQLYVYTGNCAVQYPLSSGSYMGIVAGVLGIAGGVASTMLSGGALLPMALGAGASAMGNMKTKVEHSGSLSGNSGAMGIKKPYLIIRRPQTKIADNFKLLAGESQNEYGVLNSYTGQTRVKYVHLENIPATDSELTQIEELLKSGVLI